MVIDRTREIKIPVSHIKMTKVGGYAVEDLAGPISLLDGTKGEIIITMTPISERGIK